MLKFDIIIPSLAVVALLVLGAALMASGLERKLQPKECVVEAAAQQ